MDGMTDDQITRTYGALSTVTIPEPLLFLAAALRRNDTVVVTGWEGTHSQITAEYGQHLVDITDPAAKAEWDARVASEWASEWVEWDDDAD